MPARGLVPRELRRARRPGQFDERSAAQLSEEEKAARADYVYVNDGTTAELERWVSDLVGSLVAA